MTHKKNRLAFFLKFFEFVIGQHALTQEELEPFLEELDKALSLLRERLPKGRRLWCRYGLCLF